MYYLDSSSLMTGVNAIPGKTDKYVFTTSVLAIIERLSGAGKDDKSFGRARSVFKMLNESKIQIDWKMPDYYLHSGFDYVNGRFQIVEERTPDLGKILKCLMDSKDRAEFIESEKKLQLKFPLEYFEIYDSSFGPNNPEKAKEEIEIVKQAFLLAKEGKYDSLVPEEVLQQGFAKFSEWFAEQNGVLNDSLTVWSLAQRTAKSCGLELIDKNISEIYNSYNDKTRVFVTAYSKSSIRNIGAQNLPGRNDPIDLAHLLYLREGMHLVTEDKKMRQVAEAVPVKVFSITEL